MVLNKFGTIGMRACCSTSTGSNQSGNICGVCGSSTDFTPLLIKVVVPAGEYTNKFCADCTSMNATHLLAQTTPANSCVWCKDLTQFDDCAGTTAQASIMCARLLSTRWEIEILIQRGCTFPASSTGPRHGHQDEWHKGITGIPNYACDSFNESDTTYQGQVLDSCGAGVPVADLQCTVAGTSNVSVASI